MRYIAIALCLLAVSAWGQGRDTIIVDSGFIRVSSQSTMYPDSLYDPSAKFDTLYWQWDNIFAIYTDHIEGTCDTTYEERPMWIRRGGRWDTTVVTVCDTVWGIGPELIYGQPNLPYLTRITISACGDTIRAETGLPRCRDSLVVDRRR